MKPRITRALIPFVVVASLYASAASAAVVLADPGAAPGVTTVTFDNPSLPSGTLLTNQYASLGVTFQGKELYSSNFFTNNSPAMVGNHADSYSGGGGGTNTSIWDFVFSSPVAFAGAYFEFNLSSNATFEALLAGNVVDSYVYTNTNCCSTPQFVGLTGASFDTLRLKNVTGQDFYMENLRFSDVTSAVPEPATWAMMLFGFGAIGFAMRRRRVSGLTQNVRLSYT